MLYGRATQLQMAQGPLSKMPKVKGPHRRAGTYLHQGVLMGGRKVEAARKIRVLFGYNWPNNDYLGATVAPQHHVATDVRPHAHTHTHNTHTHTQPALHSAAFKI